MCRVLQASVNTGIADLLIWLHVGIGAHGEADDECNLAAVIKPAIAMRAMN